MLQNLPYSMYKKIHIVFFSFSISSNFEFYLINALVYVENNQDNHIGKIQSCSKWKRNKKITLVFSRGLSWAKKALISEEWVYWVKLKNFLNVCQKFCSNHNSNFAFKNCFLFFKHWTMVSFFSFRIYFNGLIYGYDGTFWKLQYYRSVKPDWSRAGLLERSLFSIWCRPWWWNNSLRIR